MLPTPASSIALDPGYLKLHGREATQRAILDLVRSVRVEWIEHANVIRLLGPEMSYHDADPHLDEVLSSLGLSRADVPAYRSNRALFDLCFEDSWTGWFMARQFEQRGRPDSLLMIHLDDHTDMMPTLLTVENCGLADPSTGRSFDPAAGADWEAAIRSGAVSIGNYITPFFFSGIDFHVRHLNHGMPCGLWSPVMATPRRYELVPDRSFASVEKTIERRPQAAGSHRAGSDATLLFAGLPPGRTFVHVDLDYFINDFNGAVRSEPEMPDEALQRRADARMDAFFVALATCGREIDRWMIATSPGFCSARHWARLIAQLSRRIEAFDCGAASTPTQ